MNRVVELSAAPRSSAASGPASAAVAPAASFASGAIRRVASAGVLRVALAAIALVGLAGPARAADAAPKPSTGAQLRAVISGNTVTGSMDSSGRYTEFYAADGTVHGKDYRAKWTIEGDTMCWLYDGQPKDCWQAALRRDQVKWIKDGKVQGSGTVLKGNPEKF
jgi:hypothetical protein